MFDKLKDLYAVFQTGKMVANPAAWKRGQMNAGMVAGLLGALVALAKGFGYVIPLSDDQLLQIGGAAVALFGLYNTGVTVVSTDKLGLSPRTAPEPVPERGGGSMVAVPANVAVEKPVEQTEQTDVPYIRRAANGDVLDGLDSTYSGA